MPATKPEDIVTIEVDVDTKRAIQQTAQFQRSMLKQMQHLTTAMEKSTEVSTQVAKRSTKDTDEWAESVDDVTDAYEDQSKSVDKVARVIAQLQKRAQAASGDEKKYLKEQIQALEKLGKARKKTGAAPTGLPPDDPRGQKLRKRMSAAGDALKAPLQAFMSRDLRRTMEESADVFGKAAKAGLMGIGKLKGVGAGMAARGEALGGGKGAALKGVGVVSGKMGQVAETLGKLGPILGMATGAIVGLVKLFIDLDAKAKEFNNEILTSASTSEFFYANMQQADVAAAELEETLKGIRDAANDASFNLKWGVLAEDHAKILNVMTQEGVSLHSIKLEAEGVAKSLGKSVRTTEDSEAALADYEHQLVATSLAFSRSFGLPLNEINQMQAEMMRDLGMSLQETQLAFHQVSRTAAESGQAANKFFAVIRGVSQDLSLYNTRMEDAVKLLGLMNRVMNPRNAQKFFQTAVQGLKNMGQDERLKLNLLTGAKGAKILAKDLKRREATVNKEIGTALGMQAEEVGRQLKDPEMAKSIWERLQKAVPERAGTLREAATEMKIDTTASKRGVYGQAFAMENLTAGAALDAMTEALAKWGGGKTLMEGAGTIGMTKMAENLGVGTEQLRNMMKLEGAIQDQKDALVAEGKMTRKQADQLSAADVMDTMSDDIKSQLADSNKEINYAKQQTDLTTSWMKKFDILVAFVMNEIYNVMSEILETIQGVFGGGKAKEKLAITKQIKGNEELVGILRKTGDDLGAFHKAAIGSETGKSVTRQLTGFEPQKMDLGRKIAEQHRLSQDAATEEERKAAASKAQTLEKQQQALVDQQRSLRGAIGRNLLKGGGGKRKVLDILRDEKIGDLAKIRRFSGGRADLEKEGDIQTALEEAGLNGEEIAQFFAKAMWRLSSQQVAGVLTDFGKAPAGTPVPEKTEAPKPEEIKSAIEPRIEVTTEQPKVEVVSPAKPPPAQQNASVKSAGAGTFGGGAVASTGAISTTPQEDLVQAVSSAVQKFGGGGTIREGLDKLGASKMAEQLGLSAEQVKELAKIEDGLRSVKFDRTFLKSDMQRSTEQAVLDAARKALFEYYMYSAITDRSQVADYLARGGGDIGSFAAEVGEQARLGGLSTDVLTAHQSGGMVTGIQDGLATVTAAAGEGLASVGPGERIVPAGRAGGGGNINITIPVEGVGGNDLARVIRAYVVDGVAEYKRRERFT